ncbi:MAG: YkgJ family cysteine cluster protein [Armatimonadota bacterium]
MSGLTIDTPQAVVSVDAEYRFPQLARPAFEAAYYRTIEALEHEVTVERLDRLTESILSITDSCIVQAQEMLLTASQMSLACSEGCSFCCRHLVVSCNLPEALLILHYLQTRNSPLSVAEASEKVREFVENRVEHRILNLHHESGEGLDCPFLHEHQCAIYPVRPVMCRGYNAFDAHACRAYHAQPTVNHEMRIFAPQTEMAQAISTGLRTALVVKGLVAKRSYNLMTALQIAFDVPEALERWQSWKKVFHRALLHESSVQ